MLERFYAIHGRQNLKPALLEQPHVTSEYAGIVFNYKDRHGCNHMALATTKAVSGVTSPAPPCTGGRAVHHPLAQQTNLAYIANIIRPAM